MRIPSGKTDQVIYFVAVDSTDLKTRETGLSSFTVYRSRNGGAAAAYTTPTVTELSSANMPGVYSLLIDEDTTIASGSDSEEYCVHITQASMAPVTRTIELYRRDTTTGTTITVANGCADADIERLQGNVIATPTVSGVLEVDVTHFNGVAGTFASGRPEVNTTHIAGSAVNTSSAQLGVNVVNAGGTAWGSGAITAASIATGAIDADALAADAGTELGTAVWASVTRTLTAGTNIALAKGVGVTGFNDLDAAGVRSAVGLAAANLDTQLSTIDTVVDSILVNTAEIGVAGAGLTAINLPDQTMNITGNITGNLSGSVGSVTAAVTVGALNANVITAASMNADASAEIADAVWDEDATGHQTQGTFGQAIGDPVADANTIYKAVVTDAAGATIGVDVVAVKSDTTAILIDTTEIGVAGAGLTNINLPNQTMDIVGNITGNLSGSVGSVTGNVGGNVVGSVATIGAAGIADSSLAASAQNAIADAILDRNMAAGSDSGTDDTTNRTVRQALRALRNKVTVSAGTATVTKEDDTTTSWTAAVTTTSGNPMTGVDPS